MSKSNLFFVACCLLFAQTLSAQMRGWEVGGWAGASNYFGDLNDDFRLNSAQLALGAGARFNINNRLAWRFGAAYGSLAATDADSKNIYQQRRNLSFNSLLLEANGTFEFNFLPYEHGDRENFFTPYMFVGPTFYYFNPRAKLNDTWYDLVEYGTEGQFKGEEYNTFQFALAYGFGLKFDLSYRWSVDMFVSGRKLYTDYLDDVSGAYPDLDDLRADRGQTAVLLSDRSQAPRIGQAGRQRGDANNNDSYALAGIGLNYYFGSIHCPKWLKN